MLKKKNVILNSLNYEFGQWFSLKKILNQVQNDMNFLSFISPRRGLKVGFTLAEVLVTLTILGILASIIVPNVVQKYNDKADVAKLRGIVSTLNNALQVMVVEKGPISSWAFEETTNRDKSIYFAENVLPKYVRLANSCEPRNCPKGAWLDEDTYFIGSPRQSHSYYKSLKGVLRKANGPDNDIFQDTVVPLKNGAYISFMIYENSAKVYIDINGTKSPGRYGYDMFVIYFDDNGNLDFTNSQVKSKANCNSKGGNTWELSDGAACSTWILKHNNMKYKYKDVSAEW